MGETMRRRGGIFMRGLVVLVLVATALALAPGGTSPARAGSGSWTPKAPMRTIRSGFGLAAAPDGKLYVVGGDEPPRGGSSEKQPASAVVEAYDPATGTWEPKAPMPTARM